MLILLTVISYYIFFRGNLDIQFESTPEFYVVNIKIPDKSLVRNLKTSGPWVWIVRDTVCKKGGQYGETEWQ